MRCPTCHKQAEVVDTRQRKDGTTYRRYLCANMHRFTTDEVPRAPQEGKPE